MTVVAFKILMVMVCIISALGAIVEAEKRQKGFIALFAASGALFLAACAMTNH